MLKVVILLCATGTPVADCTPASALDVIRPPIWTILPTHCLMMAQAYLAQTVLVRPDDVVKITCPRAP